MKTLIDEAQLQEGIRQLAGKIQEHYQGRSLTIVGVLIESVVLVADLADEALEQSGLASQGHAVKCPKCGGINVCRLDALRRRIPMAVK